MADGTKYFSVLAMIIMFRETIEASIIVAILLSITTRVDKRLNRQVWIGALSGIVISIGLGVAFIVAYVALREAVFTGNSAKIFEGVMSWFAATLVTALSFAMLRLVSIEEKLNRKLTVAAEKALSGTKRYAVMILAFIAVIREGIESVVFLAGIGTNTPVHAIPIPAIVGLILGLIVGVIVYYTGIKIKHLKVFFILSSVFLWFIAGGLISYGYMEFQAAGVFGEMYYYWDNRVWFLRPLWDGRECCSTLPTADNKLFLFLKAVFGFSDTPTPLQLILYFGYWLIVICVIFWKLHKGTLYGRREDLDAGSVEGEEVVVAEKDLEMDMGKGDMGEKAVLELDMGKGGEKELGRVPAGTEAADVASSKDAVKAVQLVDAGRPVGEGSEAVAASRPAPAAASGSNIV